MNLDALAANLKPLDLTAKPAISDAERDYFRHYGLNFEEQCEEVIHHFGHFPSGRYNIVAHYFEHQYAVETCFIVHGYYDHSGLYSHIIEYCLKRSLSVVIFDLPGHGLSTGERASITNFADYQSVLRDVLFLFNNVAPESWFAIGQSTGAAILMDFMLSGGEDIFAKTVLLAPLVRPYHWPISSLAHRLARRFIKQLNRKFTVNSSDEEFLNFIQKRDPLQVHHLPMQWVTALKQWILYFLRLESVEYKTLVVQGKSDTTVDWEYNLPVVEGKFQGSKVFMLRNARHQLANESQAIRNKIFAAIDIYFDVCQPVGRRTLMS